VQVVVGHSEDVDTRSAVAEVVAQVRVGLDATSDPPRALVLFATLDYDRELLVREVREAFPDLPTVGCTVDAISSSTLGYHEDAIALVVFCGERLRAVSVAARDLSQHPAGARAAVAEAARCGVERLELAPLLCLTFPESLSVSGGTVLQGARVGLGDGVPVVGGTATDDLRFERVDQFFDGEVLHDSAPLLLLGGELSASWCAACGWYPVGVQGEVTAAEGPVLQRVGSESALAFYRRYLGEGMLPSGDNPLAVYPPDEPSDAFYLRAPLTVDEDNETVTFFGPVPQGSRVRVTETSRDDILAAARQAAQWAGEGFEREPRAALFFSCVSRKAHLGTRTAHELDMLREVTGNGCPALGVYTYGEFGSLTPRGSSRFLNQSIVALLLGDG